MNGDESDAADPNRYVTADGALTADGDDAGRWLDTEHARGADWDTLADTLEDIAASIGSVGDAYDNAPIESANGLYKTECIRTTIFHSGPYRTASDVEFATAGWAHCGGTSRLRGNNNTRLHSSIGYMPPIWGYLPLAGEYETLRYSGLTTEDQPHLEAAQDLG